MYRIGYLSGENIEVWLVLQSVCGRLKDYNLFRTVGGSEEK